MDNFKPVFKEIEKGQFYFEDGKWIKCGENKICSLWSNWVVSEKARRITDSEGFTVYGNITENK